MSITPPGAAKSVTDQLKELQVKHQALKDRKIRLEAELANAQRELASAQAEAESEFGTSDLEELRALYDETEQKNAAAIAGFAEKLSEIERAFNTALGQ